MMWGYDYGYPAGYAGGYGGYGVVHALISAFWILVLIALIVVAVRALRGKSAWHCRGHLLGGDAAMTTLRERYAKGEIDKQEYEERKKVLSA